MVESFSSTQKYQGEPLRRMSQINRGSDPGHGSKETNFSPFVLKRFIDGLWMRLIVELFFWVADNTFGKIIQIHE
jgi:hypothetical protein